MGSNSGAVNESFPKKCNVSAWYAQDAMDRLDALDTVRAEALLGRGAKVDQVVGQLQGAFDAVPQLTVENGRELAAIRRVCLAAAELLQLADAPLPQASDADLRWLRNQVFGPVAELREKLLKHLDSMR
jgi:hypothetical protein